MIVVLCFAAIAVGIYMMMSGLKRTGIILPDRSDKLIPGLLFPKKGQEIALLVVGVTWTIGWLFILLALVFKW